MSFAMTTAQVLDESKDVTRRLGWWKLPPGRRLWAVEKSMGIPKGEKVKRLKLIETVSVCPEPLNLITQDDVRREGFPEWTPQQFIEFFTKQKKGLLPSVIVNRIEYKYVRLEND